jgi:hypothetical protein
MAAKNANTGKAGNGKGSTKLIEADQHEATRRAKKASQNANARANAIGKKVAQSANVVSKTTLNSSGTDLLTDIWTDGRPSFQAQQREARQELERKRLEIQQNIQTQSELAVTLIAQWTMTDGARKIATAVAKAFVTARKDGDRKKTQVAKDAVRASWNKSSALQTVVVKRDLEKGLRIAGAALREAGNTVFGNEKELATASA